MQLNENQGHCESDLEFLPVVQSQAFRGESPAFACSPENQQGCPKGLTMYHMRYIMKYGQQQNITRQIL